MDDSGIMDGAEVALREKSMRRHGIRRIRQVSHRLPLNQPLKPLQYNLLTLANTRLSSLKLAYQDDRLDDTQIPIWREEIRLWSVQVVGKLGPDSITPENYAVPATPSSLTPSLIPTIAKPMA